LQQGDGVINVFQSWVTVECCAEVGPYIPGGSVSILAGVGNASGCNFFDNIKFISESISGVWQASVQEGCTG